MRKVILFFAICIYCISSFQEVNARTTKFPYTYSAKAIGQGKIYISPTDEVNPTPQEEISNKTGTLSVTSTSTQSSAKQDFYLTAYPNQGYGFKNWRKVDASGSNLSPNPLANTRKFKRTESLTTTASDNQFYYEADFEETMVSVGTTNAGRVQAFIDKEINAIGDRVVLSATTFGNYTIQWKKDGVVVSTENPLVLTVTEKAHYIANPVSASNLVDGYYRIRNAAPDYQDTNDYVRLADNWFDLTSIVGSATSVLTDRPGRIVNAQNVLARDLKVSTNVNTDVGSIVYIKRNGTSGSEYDIFAQGTHVKELTTGTHHGNNSGDIPYDGCYINILRAGPVFELYAAIQVDSYDFGRFYFYDNSHVFSTVYADISAKAKWILEPVNEENIGDFFFSASPSSSLTLNGKYYTTLRLPFKCKIPLGSSLIAYSVSGIPSTDGGLATYTKYEAGGTIPAGIPVVIENNSINADDNKLIPVDDPSPYISSANLALSTALYKNYGSHKHDNHEDYTTLGDGVGFFSSKYTGTTTLYKLGVKDGKLGFWDAVASGDTIYGNLAYSTKQCYLFEEVKTPIINPGNSDAITGQTINVTLSCETSGASIKYSINGGTTWNTYSNAIPITATTTVMAKAVKNGVESEVATATYTFTALAAPTIAPTSETELVGTDITFDVTKVATHADAVLQYSIDDGAWQAVSNNQVTVSSTTAKNGNVKVRNYIASLNVASAEATATYTFTALSAPAITPASAEAEVGETITFTATNPNGGSSTMQYRIDGGVWTTTTGTITVNSTEAKTGRVEVKVVNGNAESEVATATYTFAEAYQDITLANLVNKPVDDTKYNITDLTCINVIDNAGLLICKDDKGYAPKDVTENGWIDYMQQVSGLTVPHEYDQSNWIALRLPQGESLSSDMILKPLTGVKGHLVNATNLEFQLDAMPDFGSRVTFTPNTYIPASFKGTQESANGKTYFFVQPKPMEYAHIEWAVSRGVKFVTAPRDLEHGINTAGLSGEFEFNGMYLGDFGLEWDHVYMMDALIKRYTDNFDHVYVMGNVDGLVFDSRKGVEMYTADGKVYTATVTVSNAEGNNNGFFGFTKELGATYESIADYRYGADANNKYVTAGKYAVNKNTNSFKILPGTYTLTLDMTKGELIIAAPSANAPRRADAQSTARYIVYPVHLTETSNSIITGVMNVAGAREVAAVEYVNLAGQRSCRPWQGVNIVITRYTDGTVTTAKECK